MLNNVKMETEIVVTAKFAAGESFTAFNVTEKLRKDHPTVHVHSGIVKTEVHGLFNTGRMQELLDAIKSGHAVRRIFTRFGSAGAFQYDAEFIKDDGDVDDLASDPLADNTDCFIM